MYPALQAGIRKTAQSLTHATLGVKGKGNCVLGSHYLYSESGAKKRINLLYMLFCSPQLLTLDIGLPIPGNAVL
jgi:hypothetical protein